MEFSDLPWSVVPIITTVVRSQSPTAQKPQTQPLILAIVRRVEVGRRGDDVSDATLQSWKYLSDSPRIRLDYAADSLRWTGSEPVFDHPFEYLEYIARRQQVPALSPPPHRIVGLCADGAQHAVAEAVWRPMGFAMQRTETQCGNEPVTGHPCGVANPALTSDRESAAAYRDESRARRTPCALHPTRSRWPRSIQPAVTPVALRPRADPGDRISPRRYRPPPDSHHRRPRHGRARASGTPSFHVRRMGRTQRPGADLRPDASRRRSPGTSRSTGRSNGIDASCRPRSIPIVRDPLRGLREPIVPLDRLAGLHELSRLRDTARHTQTVQHISHDTNIVKELRVGRRERNGTIM